MPSHPTLSPAVANRLHGALEKVRREELDRYRRKLTPEEADRAARLTAGITGQLFDLLARQLAAADGRGEAESRLLVLHRVLGLEDAPRFPAANA
jgi:glutamyl-tRNA reductase